MAKTVIALYDNLMTTYQVVEGLRKEKFDGDSMSIIANDANQEYATHVTQAKVGREGKGALKEATEEGFPKMLAQLETLTIDGIGPVVAGGPLVKTIMEAGVGVSPTSLQAALMDMGLPEQDAEAALEAIRRGAALLTVRTNDNKAEKAVEIMNRYGPLDLGTSAESWRKEGWSRFDPKAALRKWTNDAERQLHRYEAKAEGAQGETRLPIMEEELKVGKRTVQRGGVRIHSHIEESPVEEQVRLREERVVVERRPADRPVSEADLEALRKGTIEVTEMAEEAVVAKEARVIEEVVIHKDVQERTETVRDTVRRTEVEIEEVGTTGAQSHPPFEHYESSFRQHYMTTYANSPYTYEQYEPVYRYGYNLATNPSYRNRRWEEIEPEVRRLWEARNPNTWEQFKDSIHHAWNEVHR